MNRSDLNGERVVPPREGVIDVDLALQRENDHQQPMTDVAVLRSWFVDREEHLVHLGNVHLF